VWQSHADLGPTSVGFIEHALSHPEMACRINYRESEALPESMRQGPTDLQSWPTFVEANKLRQIVAATEGLVALVKSIPWRIFGGDPRRIRDFYGLRDESLTALLLSPPNGIETAFARCDLIDDGEVFKCVEVNVSASLGGWQNRFYDVACRAHPGIAAFLAAAGVQVHHRDPWRSALALVLRHGLAQGHDEDGQFNVAVAVTRETTHFEEVLKAMGELFQEVLREGGGDCRGQLIKCLYPNDLVARGESLYHRRLRISAVIEPTAHPTPKDVYRCFKAGRVGLYNGPISGLLTSKANMAVLSQHEDSDLLSAEERQVVRRHVLWSRLVADEATTYHGERVNNLIDFAVARRESLVLKPVAGYQSMGVHLGCLTSPAEWLQHLRGTAGTGKVLLQELVVSRPYLYQQGVEGWASHQAVWGTFCFGGAYSGGYLRVVPQRSDPRVINAAEEGASVGLIYEV
jgi:hypothetical protein